ncbi:MAG: AAA family ATPase [Thermoguttaceae bacterium]
MASIFDSRIPEPDPLVQAPAEPSGDSAWDPESVEGGSVERLRTPRLVCEPPDLDPQQVIHDLKRVFSTLERELVGFEELLIQSVYALLTRENLLVFSPAGTAKTLCASLIFGRIRGARVFDTQMSKGTLADELFGSVDTEQLKKGRILHNTRGTLVDADFAFIDELFDANDMVLRALLGIFNERVFKKGTQLEQANLHTGIAAANYLRATDVTEAVLDRFLFRSYISPDYNPYTLLAIDQVFTRHYGRAKAAAFDDQISLEQVGFVADIVRGQLPDYSIGVPAHVMFLKNTLLNRYRELVDQAQEGSRKRAVYISPRTYAKSRILLNASALLRGRMEVTAEDLSQLRYIVTTVGGPPEQAECFDKALKETLLKIRGDDLEVIDQLAEAHELTEQIMARVRDGESVPCTRFLQRILKLFGLLSEGDVTFDHVRRFVDKLQARDDRVKALKLGLEQRIQQLTRRVDQGRCSVLS